MGGIRGKGHFGSRVHRKKKESAVHSSRSGARSELCFDVRELIFVYQKVGISLIYCFAVET